MIGAQSSVPPNFAIYHRYLRLLSAYPTPDMAASYVMSTVLPLVRTSPLMMLVSGMLATIPFYLIYHVYSKRTTFQLYKGFPLVTPDEQDLDLETAWYVLLRGLYTPSGGIFSNLHP